jgi:hypothetical protein
VRITSTFLGLKESADALVVVVSEADEDHTDQITLCGDALFEAENIAQELHDRLSAKLPIADVGNNEKDDTSCSNRGSVVTSAHKNLPELELPKFGGEALQWRSFIALFDAQVHEAPIPDVNKLLSYLMTCLQRDARDALMGLPLVDKNYAIARDILKSRYGDPGMLLALYAEKLVMLKPAPEEDLPAFRTLLDHFEGSRREMAALIEEVNPGQPATTGVGLQEIFLAPILTPKLPPSVQLVWARTCSTAAEKFNLTGLLAFARREVTNLEQMSQPELKAERAPKPKKAQTHSAFRAANSGPSQMRHGSARERRNSGRSAPAITFPACPFCSDVGHAPSNCSVYKEKSIEEQHAATARLGRCYNCLGAHRQDVCPSSKRCFVCARKHHTTLHRDADSASGPSKGLAAPNAAAERVLLQTALVQVPGLGRLARALLDTGAERSYITQALVEEAGLLVLDRQLHRFETFGGGVKSQHCPKVRVELTSRYSANSVIVELLALSMICSPVRGVRPSTLEGVGRGVDFADDLTEEDRPMDLVLGMDYLPDVLLPRAPQRFRRRSC